MKHYILFSIFLSSVTASASSLNCGMIKSNNLSNTASLEAKINELIDGICPDIKSKVKELEIKNNVVCDLEGTHYYSYTNFLSNAKMFIDVKCTPASKVRIKMTSKLKPVFIGELQPLRIQEVIFKAK